MAPMQAISQARQDAIWRHVQKCFDKAEEVLAGSRTSDPDYVDHRIKIDDLIAARRPWKVQQEILAFGKKYCRDKKERNL